MQDRGGDENAGLTEFLGRLSKWAVWGLGPLTVAKPQRQGWRGFSSGKGPVLLLLFIPIYSGHTCRSLPPATPWGPLPWKFFG